MSRRSKFIRLADDEMRNVTVNPKQSKWAYGSDDREYELMGSLDGRRHEDLYSIDLESGARKLAVKRLRYFSGASPDGSQILYYMDGDYHVYSLATGQDRNITQGLPVSFVDVEDDHNNVKPPVNAVGWASDNKTVLLDRRVGHLEGAGRRWRPRQPDRERQKGCDPLPAALRARAARRARPRYRSVEAAALPRLRRVDEEGRHRAHRSGHPGREDARVGGCDLPAADEGDEDETYVFTRGTSLEPADYYVGRRLARERRCA